MTMPDREKVIKELEWQINVFTSYCASDERLLETMKASLALLKEQPEVVMCWQCRRDNECSIQFKFAPADNPGDWFCGYGKRKEGR